MLLLGFVEGRRRILHGSSFDRLGIVQIRVGKGSRISVFVSLFSVRRWRGEIRVFRC